MLHTRRQAARLLQRPYIHQVRGYADAGPLKPTEVNKIQSDSSNTPSAHAASAGHQSPRQHSDYPTPENESIGKGVYIALAVLFGSFAIYKFSRSSSSSSSDPASAGDLSQQPFLTRLIHRFDYLHERDEIRNTLYTNSMKQIAYDKSLFEGSPRRQHYEFGNAEVVFNSGSPWNVPAGSTVDLEHVRRHYLEQNAKLEAERVEKYERKAREAREAEERQRGDDKVRETFGEVVDAVSKVGKKAA